MVGLVISWVLCGSAWTSGRLVPCKGSVNIGNFGGLIGTFLYLGTAPCIVGVCLVLWGSAPCSCCICCSSCIWSARSCVSLPGGNCSARPGISWTASSGGLGWVWGVSRGAYCRPFSGVGGAWGVSFNFVSFQSNCSAWSVGALPCIDLSVRDLKIQFPIGKSTNLATAPCLVGDCVMVWVLSSCSARPLASVWSRASPGCISCSARSRTCISAWSMASPGFICCSAWSSGSSPSFVSGSPST